MKICVSGDTMKFGNLNAGDVFIYNNEYYMKIHREQDFNVVSIKTGQLGFAKPEYIVNHVNAVMNILPMVWERM